MTAKRIEPPPLEPREFRSIEEIDVASDKLRRRIQELETIDIVGSVQRDTGAITVAASNIRDTIREVFGPNSPEFKEHEYLRIWAGAIRRGMALTQIIAQTERGRRQVIGIINGLIARLQEKKTDLTARTAPPRAVPFDRLNIHQRIHGVSRELFVGGHPWEGVFAASKALINYVKERSNQYELDGAALMRTVFSSKDPILAFNDLADQTDRDEQEGTMHLFEGAVLAIRNPGGHSFPEGPEQRAVEYICFLSLLAYRVEEAKKIR
jgi:uncharacterized protein (TIGR02391 family)